MCRYWKVWCAAKFLLAGAAGLTQTGCFINVAEIAPRELRGISLVAFGFGFTQQFGGLLCAVVAYACQERWTDPDIRWSYRVPLILCIVLPFLNLILELFFLVESPYWLLMRGRDEQADQALRALHPNATEEEIATILADHRFVLEHEAEQRALQKQSSIFDCFRGPNLRRTFVAIWPGATQPLAGNAMIAVYVTYFFTQAGSDDSILDTLLVFIVGIVTYFAAGFFVEMTRLRTLLAPTRWPGTFDYFHVRHRRDGHGLACALPQGRRRFVPGTLLPRRCRFVQGPRGVRMAIRRGSAVLRAKTNALGVSLNGLLSVVYNTLITYMLNGDIFGIKGSGYWFGGWAVLSFILTYLFIPDITGRSYSNIDELFEKNVPTRKWPEFVCDGQYGHVQEEKVDKSCEV